MKDCRIEEDLEMMTKYEITANELLVVKLILYYQAEEPQWLIAFAKNKAISGNFRDLLESLQHKEIILKSYKLPAKGEKFDPNEVDFNKNFLKNYFRESFEMGKELFDAYPAFVTIRENTYPLRTISKKYNSPEDFYRAYAKIIRNKPETHKKIMELLHWALENTNFISFNICEFIISQKWNEIEMIKNGEVDTYSFNNNTIL